MKNFDWKKHAPLIAAIVPAIVCLIFDQPVPAVVILAAYFVFRHFQKKKEAPKTQGKKAGGADLIVYVAKGGTHYHYLPTCPALQNAQTEAITVTKAHKMGYTLCGRCGK